MEKVMIQFNGYETIKKHYGKKVFAVVSIEKGKDNYEYHSSEYGQLLPVESRPRGKWIVSKTDSNFNCSICGCNPRKDYRASSLEWIREINGCDMQYCPWCGADMRGDE